MILTAHQPVYLPWCGLFHKIAMADMFISFNQVQYQPKDWNNRNLIKTHSGPTYLTVPVLRKGYLHKSISDIEINNSLPWARKHWKSISMAYASAPFFDKYKDFFESIYSRQWDRLVELNEALLVGLLDLLRIPVPVRSAGDWDFEGEKSNLVLDMCQKVGATKYISGAMGVDYVDISSFENARIELYFQDYEHPTYPQLHGEFVSHLSVLDLLFNCGDRSLDVLMSGNLQRECFSR